MNPINLPKPVKKYLIPLVDPDTGEPTGQTMPVSEATYFKLSARLESQRQEAMKDGKFIVTAVQQRDPKHGIFVSPDDLTRAWNFHNQVQDVDEGAQE